MGEIEVSDHIIEWDDKKDEINRKKHGIRFSLAARVFLDDYRIEDFDELHSDYEDRIKVIGMVDDVLSVIYTERGEKYRIISARQADKKEESDYYGQFSTF